MHNYYIQLRGHVDEDEINRLSPLQMVREWSNTAVTRFSVHTDQSGIIGLMRHLHGLGYIFLSVYRESAAANSQQLTINNQWKVIGR